MTRRSRDPDKLHRLVEVATEEFATAGYERTKVHRIAELARVSPGTVYLYATDKAALFELAFLRAAESPTVALVDLPFAGHRREERTRIVDAALEATVHFPQLWVANQRRHVADGTTEYRGILVELAQWIARYRRAVALAHQNRPSWPELADAFERIVWTDLRRRLASHLGSRMRTGHLHPVGDPALLARLTLDALAGAIVANPIHGAALTAPDLVGALSQLLVPVSPESGYGAPLPSHPLE